MGRPVGQWSGQMCGCGLLLLKLTIGSLCSRKRRRGKAYISEQAGEEEEGIRGNAYVATAF